MQIFYLSLSSEDTRVWVGGMWYCGWRGVFMTAIVQAVVSRSTLRNGSINDSSKQLLEMLPIREDITKKFFCVVFVEC